MLAHPFFPENVGSIARAMRVTGFEHLAIVGGPEPTHPQALKLAVGASGILEAAIRYEALDEAIAGIPFVVGTTPDRYDGWRDHAPREAARLAMSWATRGPIALVFGNEKNGLSRHALERCHVVLRIPQVGGGPALNLAQAAMIVCYEWMCAANEDEPMTGLPDVAPPEVLAGLEAQLEDLLARHGFLKPHNASKKLGTLRRILGRLQLSAAEIALLRGIISELAGSRRG